MAGRQMIDSVPPTHPCVAGERHINCGAVVDSDQRGFNWEIAVLNGTPGSVVGGTLIFVSDKIFLYKVAAEMIDGSCVTK